MALILPQRKLDSFIEYLVNGLTVLQAARASEIPLDKAMQAWELPHVQLEIRSRVRALAEDAMVHRNDLLFVARQIMHDPSEASKERLKAVAVLARLTGADKPTEVVHRGVMLVPVPENWEAQAAQSQSDLKERVRAQEAATRAEQDGLPV